MAFLTARPRHFKLGYTFVLLIVFMKFILVSAQTDGCNIIRNIYQRKGFNLKDVPVSARQGERMGTCGTGFSCCTSRMEYKLTETCGEEFEGIVYDASFLVRDSYVNKARKFDDFFIELLDNSETDFRAMFQHTYGDIYKAHAGIFSTFYSDLRHFYHGDDDNLQTALDDLFATLLQKMYELLNPGHYTDDFMVCIAEHMHELKPFGPIPEKLQTQVRRSLNAARTYVQGLDTARDIIMKATKETPSSECKAALMKMKYCPSCKGKSSEIKPCDGLCTNIMKACLGQQTELDEEWKQFIDEMLRLGERMGSSFDIETVIDSIDVKISEAIMNYQDNTDVVSEKVFEGCGHHLRKRSADKDNKRRSRPDDWSRYRPQINKQNPSTALGTNLNSLIAESNTMLTNSRDFWSSLPYLLCHDEAYAAEASNQNCWTGVHVGNYETAVVPTGLQHQSNNPEVEMVNTNTRSTIVEYQTLLKAVTVQLNKAYNGKDTIFIDDEDYGGSGSGSGSGSGDGYRAPDVTDVHGGFTSTTIDNDPKYRPTRFPPGSAAYIITSSLSILLCSILVSLLVFCH